MENREQGFENEPRFEEVQKLIAENGLPKPNSLFDRLGIKRPVLWIKENCVDPCLEQFEVYADAFTAQIGLMVEQHGVPPPLMMIFGPFVADVAKNFYQIGYAKCLDSVVKDRNLLDKVREK